MIRVGGPVRGDQLQNDSSSHSWRRIEQKKLRRNSPGFRSTTGY